MKGQEHRRRISPRRGHQNVPPLANLRHPCQHRASYDGFNRWFTRRSMSSSTAWTKLDWSVPRVLSEGMKSGTVQSRRLCGKGTELELSRSSHSSATMKLMMRMWPRPGHGMLTTWQRLEISLQISDSISEFNLLVLSDGLWTLLVITYNKRLVPIFINNVKMLIPLAWLWLEFFQLAIPVTFIQHLTKQLRHLWWNVSPKNFWLPKILNASSNSLKLHSLWERKM